MKKSIYHRKDDERMISIKAESEIFSVKEIVRESAAVKRLVTIRNSFEAANKRHHNAYKLKVETGVYNPTLF